MKKANQDIRNLLTEKNVKQWQLAEALGLREDSLSRKMRHELPCEDKIVYSNIIKLLCYKGGGEL